jgi:hypothetical protein
MCVCAHACVRTHLVECGEPWTVTFTTPVVYDSVGLLNFSDILKCKRFDEVLGSDSIGGSHAITDHEDFGIYFTLISVAGRYK